MTSWGVRARLLLLLACLLPWTALVSGCGSTSYQVLEPPARPLGAYDRLELTYLGLDAKYEAWAAGSPDESRELLLELTEELRDGLADDAPAGAGGPLELRVTVRTHEEEYAPTRLIGGGARLTATVVLDVQLLEAGQPAGRVLATGLSEKGGWYVPSLGAAEDRAVDAVLEFVSDHR